MDISDSICPNSQLRRERILRNWRQRDLAEHLGTTVVTVNRWERGIQQPSAYYRLKLCALFGKRAQELGLFSNGQQRTVSGETEADASGEAVSSPCLSASPSRWSVPYPRNPFFTGREDLLRTLHEKLNREHTMALTQSWAISGLGGIGKTQIALEYAYMYRQNYHFIFWTNAATRESLLASFLTLADLLALPEKDEGSHDQMIRAVKKWLASHEKWLWILDNADDLTMVSDFVPAERPGHLLFTTRAQALGALAQRMEVETMGMAEGALFVLRRAKLLAPDASLEQASEDILAATEAIVIEMDFLPLALDQAGAYIEEVGCSLSAYLDIYRTHRKELLQRRGHMPTHHAESVTTTFSLSFQKIEQTNPTAAELLRLYAFLEPDSIPEEIISKGSAFLGPILQDAATDVLILHKAIEELRKFSLVQIQPEARLLRVHRLVQAVLKDALGMEEQRFWAERAIQVINAAFPTTVKATTWPLCQRYLSQAQECTRLIQKYAFTFESAAALLFRTASYLYEYALYPQAEALYQQALHIWEQTLGPLHPDVAHSLHRLALLYSQQGKYEQAEALYQQALHIWEQTLGPLHPDVADSFYRLAILCAQQGKDEQAESLFLQALYIREQVLAPDDPNIANTLDGLAILFARQGKYEQAEPLFQRSLCIREQALGPDHPDLAASLNNLADFYLDQGKDEQAKPLFQRAVCIWERTRGPDHLYLAYPLAGLAKLYARQNQYKQAEALYRRALHIREHCLASHHPDTAEILHNFAVFQASQGNSQEAAALYQQTLIIREEVFGTLHPQTEATRRAYAALLQDIQQNNGTA